MKLKNQIKLLMGLFLTYGTGQAAADAPAGYYNSCENKGGETLLSALYSTITTHTNVGYDGLWNVYRTSDVNANGKIWDMYSTKEWTFGQSQCGNYKLVGDCYNREHSFPKSWFSQGSPMVSDAFHIYPTDGKVNGQRSNYPYGECANGTTLASNGAVKALGRLGTSTFSGYTGTVFEPDDQYKGDFARSYFYMAACYYDKIKGWSSPMLAGNAYPAFTSWAIDLLLKWHRQDPVSQKEINRNDAVYAYQKNRNPFIDNPEMVEYIWGDKTTEKWSATIGRTPEINTPVNGSSINIGTASVGHQLVYTLTVKGSHLTDNVTVTASSSAISVSPTSISATEVNQENGAVITVTYVPTSTGTINTPLTIKSGNITSTVRLIASAVNGLPAMPAEEISENEFVARWTYIGDTFSGGKYRLTVNDDNGALAGYPIMVDAESGRYLVEGLQPATKYSYTIASQTQTSSTIDVTTATPMPSVEFYYDGDLSLSSEPGVPSDAAELDILIENIDTDITLEVDSPFQLSTDKTNWSEKIVINPDEDRCYIRVNSSRAGSFVTSITATAGEYINDDASVPAIVSEATTFIEDFEAPVTTSSYNGGEWLGTAATWFFYNVGMFENTQKEAYNGNCYARFGKNSDSSIEMRTDKANGIGTVEMYAACWSSSDGDATIELLYSTDKGETWQTAGEAQIKENSYSKFTFTVNATGNVRLKLQQTYGARCKIDDISASNYHKVSGCADPVSDYHAWDAFCRNGALVIEASADTPAAVYGIDGITYLSGTISAGETSIDLPAGLYIVSIGDYARRVLIK